MFIPTTTEEVSARGWDALDVIIVSGDTYTDNSYNGSALIGHWLISNGFRVGIIAQPRMDSADDITRLGTPELYWSVSAGCVDSMVANYTAVNKFRKDDDFTPGGINNRRPDRACIAYTNLIKKYAKGKPIILGGIEASLRRVAHYDYWSDSVRRSILLDSKADAITYGMSELSNLRIAQCMRDGKPWNDTDGICYASKDVPEGYIEMPTMTIVRRIRHHSWRHSGYSAITAIRSRPKELLRSMPIATSYRIPLPDISPKRNLIPSTRWISRTRSTHII